MAISTSLPRLTQLMVVVWCQTYLISAQGNDPRSLFKQSTFDRCITGKGGVNYACVFSNVATFNGKVYFISSGSPIPEMPNVCTSLAEISTGGHDVYVMPQVVSAEEFSKLTAGAEVERAKVGIIASFLNNYNILHILGEFMTTLHAAMCSVLGLCDYNEDLAKETVLVNSASPYAYPMYATTALKICWRCFGAYERPWWLAENDYKKKVYIYDTSLIGFGQYCFQYCPHDDPNFDHRGRIRMTTDLFTSFRKRMATCLGLPFPGQVDPNKPVVTIINRNYGTGRTILNSQMLAKHITGSTKATVREVNLEDLEYLEQARIAQGSAILLVLHGAGLAVATYLPDNAVIIHILHQPYFHYNLHEYARHWATAMSPAGITMLEYTNKDVNTMFMMRDRLEGRDWYKNLNDTEKSALVMQMKCPEHANNNNQCNFAALHYSVNVALKQDDIVPLVQQALQDISAKVAKALQ